MTETKKYHRGYVMGVFDLFHVGHLNLISKAKERCEHLTVGLLTDEVTEQIKHIRPTIPFEERKQVLLSVRYVDEVVAIDEMKYLSKVREWHRHPYDCLFSGDDYADNPYWLKDREELRKLGSNIEFFHYYQGQSSSRIRKQMLLHKNSAQDSANQQAGTAGSDAPMSETEQMAGDISGPVKVVIWAIGYLYNRMYKSFRYLEQKGEIEIVSLMQTDPSPYVNIDGYPVMPKEKLKDLQFDYIIVCNKEHFAEITETIMVVADIPRSRILSYESVMHAEDSLLKYLHFVNSRPTIISNTCWAGFVYRYYNMQCLSPFRNLWVPDEDYIRLVKNLKFYLDSYVPVFSHWCVDENSGKRYPVMLLGDVSLNFNHSDSPQECIDEWMRRKERMNWDNIIVEFYTSYPEYRRMFSELEIPYRKIIFTTDDHDAFKFYKVYKGAEDLIDVDAVHKEVVPGSFGTRFNLLNLLEGNHEDVYRSLSAEEYALYQEENDAH